MWWLALLTGYISIPWAGWLRKQLIGGFALVLCFASRWDSWSSGPRFGDLGQIRTSLGFQVHVKLTTYGPLKHELNRSFTVHFVNGHENTGFTCSCVVE